MTYNDLLKKLAAEWMEEAAKCKRRSYHHMAATCEKIANSYLEQISN